MKNSVYSLSFNTGRIGFGILPLVFAAALLIPAPEARAQGPLEVRLDVSPQLFTVLCALRAGAPHLTGSMAPPSLAVSQVDRALRELDPSVTAPIKQFLDEAGFAATGTELSNFVSLALIMQGPPNFEFLLPKQKLPPDALPLAEFQALLPQFYRDADIGSLWQSVAGAYERAQARHQPVLARQMPETRGYLRIIRSGALARFYAVYPEWLLPQGLVSARNYGPLYFLALHPNKENFEVPVRHQYLHFLLDPLVSARREEMSDFAEVAQTFVDGIPRLPDTFKRDALLLIGESLIQAAEVRLLNLKDEEMEAELDRREKDGYLFIRHFVRHWMKFEESDASIRLEIPRFFEDYSLRDELTRLSRLKFSPEVPEAERAKASPPPDPAGDLLREAEDHMRRGDYEAARKMFRRVLDEFNPEEERAWYGLGLAASAEGYRSMAAEYFERTLSHGSRPPILGWAHVYLGRILDLEGAREIAVTHYQAALDAGSGIERIERAARQGLQQPFGEE